MKVQRGREVSIPLPPAYDDGVQNCIVDADNVLWANAQSAGLFSWASDRWTRRAVPDPSNGAQLLASDRQRRLMLLLQSGELIRAGPDGRRYDVLFRSQGHVGAIYAGASGFYVGGAFGLARIRDGRVRVLSSRRFPWLRDVSSIVETPAGQTWIAAKAGIVAVDTAALRRAFSDSASPLQPAILDFADGLPDIISPTGARIAAAGGRDGRLWFATTGGVVSVDPSRLPHNESAPPVAIRALVTQSCVMRTRRA
jgi:ligand-binding sensor domain-containing protein